MTTAGPTVVLPDALPTARGRVRRRPRPSRLALGSALVLAFVLAFVLALVLAVLGSVSPAGAHPTGALGAQSDDADLGSIGGRLFYEEGGEQLPVEGAEIVAEREGDEVGSATTDAEGIWEIEVAKGDGYSVTLDPDTLPEATDIRDDDKETISDLKVGGLRRTVVFPLGPRVTSPPFLERFGSRLVAGIRVGLIIGMAAIGLSLIFGVTGLINFAHGELVTFGALIAYVFSSSGGIARFPLLVAGVIAIGAGALFGGAMDAALFAPLRRRGTGNIALIVFTIGLSLLLRYSYALIFGNNPRPYRQFAIQEGLWLGLAAKDFVVIGIAVVAMVATGLVLQLSRLGTAMRAVSDDRDLAESSGIDVKRIIRAVWALGGALAALGGVLLATSVAVEWDLGYQQLLLMFAAVVLGGLGSAYGAMVGGLIIGVVSEVSTLWIPVDFKTAVALAALIVVLLVRPQGVLGLKERLG